MKKRKPPEPPTPIGRELLLLADRLTAMAYSESVEWKLREFQELLDRTVPPLSRRWQERMAELERPIREKSRALIEASLESYRLAVEAGDNLGGKR